MQWHFRLSHPPYFALQELFPILCSFVYMSFFHCETCKFTKHCRSSYPMNTSRNTSPFSIVHCDVWGPTPLLLLYLVIVILLPLWMTLLILLRFICCKLNMRYFILFNFHKMVDTQFNSKVGIIHSDNGGEYVFWIFLLSQPSILHQTNYLWNPE